MQAVATKIMMRLSRSISCILYATTGLAIAKVASGCLVVDVVGGME